MLASLALALVSTSLAVDVPAELPTSAFEQRLTLARPHLLLAVADAPATEAPGGAAAFDAPARYQDKSATQLHDEGQTMRLVLAAPAAFVVMSGTTFVTAVLVIGMGFADASPGLFFTVASLGVLAVPASGAATTMLVGSFFGGQGGFFAPFLGGIGGAALGLGLLATLASIEGGAPAFGAAVLGVPLLATTGMVLGYEWSSGKRAAELDFRASRSAQGPVLVPVFAPTKDGAVGGLALAF